MKYTCQYSYDDVFVAGFGRYDTSMIFDGDSVQLVAEPNNQYDPNAIAVMHSEKLVGYIPRGALQDMYHDYIHKGGLINATVVSADKMILRLEYLLPDEDSRADDEPEDYLLILDSDVIRSLNDAAFMQYAETVVSWAKRQTNKTLNNSKYDQAMAMLGVIKSESQRRANVKLDLPDIESIPDSPEKSPMVPKKVCNKWVAFLLCLFMGPFGAHKFYERKHWTGFLYLFTCGVFFFGWVVDLLILVGKPREYPVY